MAAVARMEIEIPDDIGECSHALSVFNQCQFHVNFCRRLHAHRPKSDLPPVVLTTIRSAWM